MTFKFIGALWTTASSPVSRLTETHFNRFMKLSDSLKATASFSNVTSNTVWGHANQLCVNGVETQWNLGAENVVQLAMRPMKVTKKWTSPKKFSFSISEVSSSAKRDLFWVCNNCLLLDENNRDFLKSGDPSTEFNRGENDSWSFELVVECFFLICRQNSHNHWTMPH